MADFAFKPHLELDNPPGEDDGGRAYKSFKIMRGDKHVGSLHTESYGRRVEINDVEGVGGPNSLGPSHVRHLAKQLKEHWPEMKTVGGFRMSGARPRGGTTEVKVK